MIRLLKSIWNLLTHKANSAAAALDKLVTSKEKLDTVKHDLLKQLVKQKEDAINLFASQERMTDDLTSLEAKLKSYKAAAKDLKKQLEAKPESAALKSKLQVAAVKYVETESVFKDLKSQEKAMNLAVEKAENALRMLNTNKLIIDAKEESLNMKINLYQNMKNISETGVIDINRSFEEIDKVIKDIKYEVNANTKAEELVHEDDDKSYNSSDVEDFISKL